MEIKTILFLFIKVWFNVCPSLRDRITFAVLSPAFYKRLYYLTNPGIKVNTPPNTPLLPPQLQLLLQWIVSSHQTPQKQWPTPI